MASRDHDLPELLPQLEPFLRDWVDAMRRRRRVPGIQVAVRLGDRLLFSYASGLADASTGAALTTGHAFRIASHSKTFTATAIMQLVERGRLRLDDTVGAVVPELADAPIAGATVRELLGHQSGAERDGADAVFWQRERAFPDRAELIETMHRDRVFGSNTHFHYSNLAYSVLGLIVEAVTGRGWNEVALELVAPLAEIMSEPALVGPELNVGPDAPLVSGHAISPFEQFGDADEESAVIPPVDTRVEGPATGFWANAETISAWVAAHALGSGHFLTDDTKRLMQRDESLIERGGPRWYGLGWIIRKIGERRVIGHSGGFPGHITQTWSDPTTGLAVSVLTNRIDGPATEIANGVIALIDAARAAVEDVSAAVLRPELAGTYLSLWGSVSLMPLPGVVLEASIDGGDPAGGLALLRETDGALRAKAEDGFGDAGEELLIDADDEGAVRSVTITGIRHHRRADFPDRRAAMLAP
ncbi:serine hydrolase domain-containing protein [Microbacterium gorillae]|uniref:serine hydrolase domain-containing protein n=1 Tax=Microbacterium gorillae TaxID=1231063 RepID=UPI0006947855|nr:serine hydrolase domain-containing protein [Microbacterium gorillae]